MNESPSVHVRLYAKAMGSIMELYNDQSVTPEETVASLRELAEEIATLIESLEAE